MNSSLSMARSFGGTGFVLLLSAVLTSALPANTYYLATNGDDANAGTIDHPWKTVQHAVGLARADDTVYLRGGAYDEGEVWIRGVYGQGGTLGHPLTIAAFPGETPLLANGSRPFIVDADNVRVDGLGFANGKSIAVWGLDRTNVALLNNRFTGRGYGYAAINVTGNNMLLENNVCDIEGNTVGTEGHCFYVSHGSDIVVRGNVARGMTGYGIHVFDQRRSEDASSFERLIQNVTIENNVTYESEERAGIIVAAYDHASLKNIVIRNNLVYDNAGYGIVVRSQADNVQVDHNTIVNNGAGGISIGGDDHISGLQIRNNIIADSHQPQNVAVWNDLPAQQAFVLDTNLYEPATLGFHGASDSHPLHGAPKFVDEAHHDLHLMSDSAAIDRGVAIANVVQDRDGITRPQGSGYDLGAYERAAAASPYDVSRDGHVDAHDIDLLTRAIHNGNSSSEFDINRDGFVNNTDRMDWVHFGAHTTPGDANLDLAFDSADILLVFQGGHYETDRFGDAGWETGDWNGDLRFESDDLILALQEGNYESLPQAVPEPTGSAATLLVLISFVVRCHTNAPPRHVLR